MDLDDDAKSTISASSSISEKSISGFANNDERDNRATGSHSSNERSQNQSEEQQDSEPSSISSRSIP